jgi:predicted P-loop ATPase
MGDEQKKSGIEIVVLTKAGGSLSKKISLDDGKVVSDGSACAMAHGRARRVRLAGLEDLAALIERLDSNQALALGALREDLADEIGIATAEELASAPRDGVVARTASNIRYVEGEPALGLFDYDTKDMPTEVAAKIEALGGFWGALVSVVPSLGAAGHLARRSTSSGLSNAETGENYRGSSGVHEYVEAEDGGDFERFLKTVHDRAWLTGLGWHAIGKAGQFLERSIVDRGVGQGERLVFEAAPNVVPPLRQDAASRRPVFYRGGRIDTRACPPLTAIEEREANALKAESRRRLEPERKQVREAYLDAEARKLVGHRKGMSLAEARAAVERRIDGRVLLPDFILPWDDPEAIATVGDVLDHPAAFEGAHLADPIEGPDYGRGKATVMIGREDGVPFIHTFAHGGGVYRLRYDARAIRERIEKASDKPDALARLLLAADVDAVEEDRLVKEVAKKAGVGIKAVRSKIKDARAERNQRGGADGFELDRNGRPIANQRNIRRALELLGVGVRYDEFNDQVLVDGHAERTIVADDALLDELWLLVEERYRFLPRRDFFFTVVTEAARRNTFHPVRDYFDGLKWDGVPRLDRWLVDYCGAEATEYVCAVGALALVACVRRVRKPGEKFDEMLILEGPQGIKKSTALRTMAVRDEWFLDDLSLSADAKKIIEQTRGRFIVEVSELSGMKKTEVEHLKAMLSRQTDRSRLVWEKTTSDRPRQFVAFGTSNDSDYLKDITGNRRFWPVAVTKIDDAALARDRDQLWAEAAAREATGESIRLDPELWGAAGEEQEDRTVADPWHDILRDAFGDLTGKILATDVWKLVGVPKERRSQEHNARLGRAMKKLKFERKSLQFDAKKQRGYAHGTPEERENRIYCHEVIDRERSYELSHQSPDERQHEITEKTTAEMEKIAKAAGARGRGG